MLPAKSRHVDYCERRDRKSTRLNSSHSQISYAVFCLKKKKDKVYHVLDFVEFLESKYSARQTVEPNVVQKFAAGVQDPLRAANVTGSATSQTVGLIDT